MITVAMTPLPQSLGHRSLVGLARRLVAMVTVVMVVGVLGAGAQYNAERGGEDSQAPLGNSPMKRVSDLCKYPCGCKQMENLHCQAGIPVIRDGCGCCFICARQQGEICDDRQTCDIGFYCDLILDDGLRGVCRARPAESCMWDGTVYKDGEQFKANCSMMCSCQDGQVSCTSLCPHEDRAPSTVHCKDPLLVKIGDECCREWVCPHSHSRPGLDDDFTHLRPIIRPTSLPKEKCENGVSEWSACSKTCGMGVSVRITNENKDCLPVNERRHCVIRPCELNDKHMAGPECKSTWKWDKDVKLKYEECESVLNFRPKYCSTCKRRKCCAPGRTRTVQVEFKCPGGKRVTEPFMWIKNCECKKRRHCPF